MDVISSEGTPEKKVSTPPPLTSPSLTEAVISESPHASIVRALGPDYVRAHPATSEIFLNALTKEEAISYCLELAKWCATLKDAPSPERLAAFSNKVTSLRLKTLPSPENFYLNEIVLASSKEPRNDLGVIAAAGNARIGISPTQLRTYYGHGHRFIPHVGLLSKEHFDKSSPQLREGITLLGKIARAAHYPPQFSDHQELARETLKAPAKYRSAFLDVALQLYEQLRDTPSEYRPLLETLFKLRDYCNQDKESGTTLLASYLHGLALTHETPLPQRIDMIKTLMSEDPFNVDLLSGAFEEGKFAEVAVHLYRKEQADTRIQEKPLEQLELDFLTAEHKYSELPPARALQRALVMYRRICEQEAGLGEMETSTLRERAKALRNRMRGDSEQVSDEIKVEFFALARELFQREFSIRPYNTQMVAVLLMTDVELLKKEDGSMLRGLYQQIKTGEGKSLVLALLSSYFGMCGEKVDIITSNHYLAGRDVLRFTGYYEHFGLTCSHFEYAPRKKDQKEVRNTDIIYSTSDSFIFALLGSRLEGLPFFGNARLRIVLVDEADNFTQDLQNEHCRISTKIKPIFALEELKAIFEFSMNGECNLAVDRRGETIKKLQQSCPTLMEKDPKKIFLYLTSAVASREKREEVDYVIRGKKIVIIDKEQTGRLRDRTQWGLGMHDFIAFRHNLPQGKVRGLAASMGHTDYLNMYRRMYCISGTIGDKLDREEMRALFKLRGFDIPPHYPSQRIDAPLVLYPSRAAWEGPFLERIKTASVLPGERANLIASVTIEKARRNLELLKAEGIPAQYLTDAENLSMDGSPSDEQTLIDNCGKKHVRSVTTGVSGRGADIKLDPECSAAGGLDVVITDIPPTFRAEMQLRGRGGRQGLKGSAVVLSNCEDDYFLSVLPSGVKSLATVLSSRAEFGPESDELRKLIDFSRRAFGVVRAVEKRIARRKDHMLQELQRTFFDKTNAVTEELFTKYPDLRPAPEDVELGNPFLDQIQAEWATEFNSFNFLLELKAVDSEKRVLDQQLFSRVKALLEETFLETFGYPFSKIQEVSDEERGYRTSLKFTVVEFIDRAEEALKNGGVVEDPEIRAAISEITRKIEGWVQDLRIRYLAGPKPENPRAGSRKDPNARFKKPLVDPDLD